MFYKRKAWRDGQGIFRLNLNTSIVSLPRARIKGRWLTPLSGETLPFNFQRYEISGDVALAGPMTPCS
jgi:hypothetical protein